MRRGTRVGQAYIALTVDGSGVNDDIVDSMDEVDFDALGNKHGEEYESSLRSHLDSISDNFREMAREMGRAFDSEDAIGTSISRRVALAFNNGDLDALMKNVGERTGTEFGGAFGEQFDTTMRASVLDSVERNLRDAATRGDVELSGMFNTLGRDDENGEPGFRMPGSMMNAITDQAVADFESRVKEQTRLMADEARAQIDIQIAAEERTQSDREAVWRRGFDRHAEFEREFSELLAEETRERLAVEERVQSDRQAIWRQGFDRDAERQAESARVYQALMDGQTARLERSLADRAQAEDDDARRRNRVRIQYEADFARLLEQREQERFLQAERRETEMARMERARDDDRYKRFQEMARRMSSAITFDPRIDTDRINASMRQLQADLEAQDDIRLRLQADLPERERARIQAELEGIRARIRVSLDEDSVNAALLRAQGIRDAASGSNGRNGSSIGDRIGGMFGAGSRNNALNLVGKSIANIINLTGGLSSAITKVTGVGGEGASMFSRMAVGAVATGAALGIVAAVAAILVSVMSALLALVVAMAATITSALVGSLLVLGGTLSAVAAGAGLLAVAFTSMDDAQKAMLKDSFQPLKAELTGIGQLMITQMIPYFDTWSGNLQRALALAAPVAGIMGQAFGQAGAIITNAFSGPGFQNFMQALGVELPSITVNLSSALGGFLNGMAGLFAVLMPYVTRFSAYLADVADDFAKWANSAAGQNSIEDFTDRALTSLESLWNFATSFFGWLGDILFSQSGQAAGNTIFDSLADSFDGFRQSIADGSLEDWFADAIDFGRELKDMISALSDTFQALNNDGALQAAGEGISTIAGFVSDLNELLGPLVDVLGYVLPATLGFALSPIWALGKAIEGVGNAIQWVKNLAGGPSLNTDLIMNQVGLANTTSPGDRGFIGPKAPFIGPVVPKNPSFSVDNLIKSGDRALNNTSKSSGGYKPDKYVNPYTDWADKLLADGKKAVDDMREAMRDINRDMAKAVKDASKAPDLKTAQTALSGAINSARAAGESMVDGAQTSLDQATRALGSSSSAKETAKALSEWNKRNRELMIALKNQAKVEEAAAMLGRQKRVDTARVSNLINGFRQSDATLAEYAAARARVTGRLEAANKRLADAIALRDQYKSAVVDATRSFGSLLTAQAQTINGIEQALTAKDITTNLKARLQQIRDFQQNMRKLLALGLSNDAYKQIVDAGVEQGGAYAAALVAGGQGSISEVNGLVSTINAAANNLGKDASSRLYQAGVDAAQGLVDGLESLSEKLDSAATRLGTSIANAVKRALGIKSPSRVMMDMMDYGVGDGLVAGLDSQHGKVGAAADRLSKQIAVSPEVAAYAAAQSKNGTTDPAAPVNDIDVTIVTPTKDPLAAAHEAVNEIVGRL